MNVAIILAGGVGSRVGAKDAKGNAIPKQFVEICGKPVLAYTIEAFERHPEIDAIEIVCIKEYKDRLAEMKTKYGFTKLAYVAEGGSTFQLSVRNGVDALRGKIAPEDIVLVHFGASPLVSEDIISDAIRVAKIRGNAISTTDFYLLCGKKKNVESVSSKGNYSCEYVDRETIACMNSPHAFRFQFVSDLYEEAFEKGILEKVEPHTTTLMYALNKPIYFSKGSQTNIKITRKEDLDFFANYIRGAQSSGGSLDKK